MLIFHFPFETLQFCLLKQKALECPSCCWMQWTFLTLLQLLPMDKLVLILLVQPHIIKFGGCSYPCRSILLALYERFFWQSSLKRKFDNIMIIHIKFIKYTLLIKKKVLYIKTKQTIKKLDKYS